MAYEPSYSEYGGMTTVEHASPAARSAFLNKVYLTVTGGVAVMMASGLGLMIAAMTSPALQRLFMAVANPIGFLVLMGAFIALTFAVQSAARVPKVNVLLYGVLCAFTGILIAPMFLVAVIQTKSMVIIWQALGLTIVTFGALTGYVLVSGKDFTFMRGFLVTGLIVVFVGILAGFFIQSSAFHLALTCVGLLLFAGFVLYDTSVIMRQLGPDEWVAGALRLFLDFFNMFIRILSLLLSARR
ncbi:MAG: Bax inhibitor-1/YccA family protein [Candidatus Sumerlaeaceae bacterium]